MASGVTVQMDAMGNLHIWEGKRELSQVAKYLYHDERGMEADAYLQVDTDTEYFLDNIPEEFAEDIENGWTVFIPDEDLAALDEFLGAVFRH